MARVIDVQSGVNARGEPFVQILNDGEPVGQLTPDEAREHAKIIMEVAEAAEQDAFLKEFFGQRASQEWPEPRYTPLPTNYMRDHQWERQMAKRTLPEVKHESSSERKHREAREQAMAWAKPGKTWDSP